MRGILLAGGMNSRLRPASLAVPKSLMPVWDAPMIYHSLCALMAAEARDILLITAPQWVDAHRRLLADGADWGVRISYAAQPKPAGIVDAYRLGADFLGGARSALALCDNIFDGAGFQSAARREALRDGGLWRGATIFVKEVENPGRFGVAVLGARGRVDSLEEKPENPKSKWVATGFYLCDGDAAEMARTQAPSGRGELEITDLLRGYMRRGDLRASRLRANAEWFDAGSPEDLLRASHYIGEKRKGGAVMGSPELTALRKGWISRKQFRALAGKLGDCDYARKILRAGVGFC